VPTAGKVGTKFCSLRVDLADPLCPVDDLGTDFSQGDGSFLNIQVRCSRSKLYDFIRRKYLIRVIGPVIHEAH